MTVFVKCPVCRESGAVSATVTRERDYGSGYYVEDVTACAECGAGDWTRREHETIERAAAREADTASDPASYHGGDGRDK